MPEFLAEDLATWCRGTWVGTPPPKVWGVSTDTRSLRPGAIFFALRGPNRDGHLFVEDAFRKGAAAVVVESGSVGVKIEAGPRLVVDDTGDALLRAAAGYRSRLQNLLVGITGSVGKSTVKEMIAQMAGTVGAVAYSPGNWNNEIGLPLSILAMESGAKVGVFEVATNHPGEIARLCKVLQPEWGVVTCVGPVHIEFFGSEEAIAREKAQLLAHLPPYGLAIVNRDTPFFEIFRRFFSGRFICVSCVDPQADYYCQSAHLVRHTIMVHEKASGERVGLRYPQPGWHVAKNMLLAAAVARQLGVSWSHIETAMSRFHPLPMRWQEQVVGGVFVINDAYNANPLSMRAAIETFWAEARPGKKWLVLGGMLELGQWSESAHEELGRLVGKNEWAGLVVVGPLGRLIARGARSAGMDGDRIHECTGIEEAANFIRGHVAQGDAVLLKASRGIGLERLLDRLVPKTDQGTRPETMIIKTTG